MPLPTTGAAWRRYGSLRHRTGWRRAGGGGGCACSSPTPPRRPRCAHRRHRRRHRDQPAARRSAPRCRCAIPTPARSPRRSLRVAADTVDDRLRRRRALGRLRARRDRRRHEPAGLASLDPLRPRIALRVEQRGQIVRLDPRVGRGRERPAWHDKRCPARPPRIIGMSLAPSPTASVSAERNATFGAPRRAAPASSPPHRRSAWRPCRSASRPRRRARWRRTAAKPISAATGPAKRVKPPETSRRRRPCAAIVRTRVRAPGVSRTRSARQRSIAASSRPLSSATRASSASAKSSSPRIAALGHRRDLGLAAGIVGQLVDAFLADHRRIHVGDEQPLAAARDAAGRRRRRPASSPSSAARASPGSSPSSRSQARPSSTQSRPCTPPSASSAAEMSPTESRSFAIRVAMNMDDSPRSRLSRGRRRAASRRSRWRSPKRANGVVINADSAQVYRDLRIVSARPTPADEARAPHRLYGYRDGADACSAADWAADAKAAIAEAHEAGRLPILVGGTGLYFRTLLDGIAPVPEIDPEIRATVRALPVAEAHAALAREDPEAAARLRPTDTTRVARALEVVRSTGRPLAAWQARTRRRHRRERRAPPAHPAAAARLAPRPLRRALRGRSFPRRAWRRSAPCSTAQLARRRAGDARDRRARDRRLSSRRDDPRRGARRRAGPPPANMPSANIPGSAASRRRTGRASSGALDCDCRWPMP